MLTTARRDGAFLRECALGKDGCGTLGYLDDESVTPESISLKIETVDKNLQQLIVVEPQCAMQVPASWKDMECCGKPCVVDKKVIRYGEGKKFCKYSPVCQTCGEKRAILLPVPSARNVIKQELGVAEDEAGRLVDEFMGTHKGEEHLAMLCKQKLIDSHLHCLDIPEV